MKYFNQDKIHIQFKMEGPVFDDGYNLYYVLNALQQFHSILDKGYMILNNKNKILKKDREIYQLKATNFVSGSFIADIEIFIKQTVEQLIIPSIVGLGPTILWDTVCQAYEYLKTMFKASKDNKSVHIESAGDGSLIVVGDNNFIVTPQALTLASRARNNYELLVDIVEEGVVNRINIHNKNEAKKSLFIGQTEKELFKSTKRVENEIFYLCVNIISFNKETNIGKMILLDKEYFGQEVSFELINQNEVNSTILSMLEQKVDITALKEIEYDPIENKEKLIKLKVINIMKR